MWPESHRKVTCTVGREEWVESRVVDMSTYLAGGTDISSRKEARRVGDCVSSAAGKLGKEETRDEIGHC